MTDPYFAGLENALKAAGYFRPTLVIDRDRLDRNLERLRTGLAPELLPRVVDKSLPSLPLLGHVLSALGSRRVMSFHLGITLPVLAAFPQVDVLFGKPMPVDAVAQAFAKADDAGRDALARRVIWLIDDRDRLDAYAALADRLGHPLAIAFEVDVGMHRGGFGTPDELEACLGAARARKNLSIAGLMGYEAHIPKIPGFAGGPVGALAEAAARFDAFAACLLQSERRILNTGGSKTVLSYDSTSRANDVSVGSALLLPSDFDTPALAGFEPAAFIATPALKVVETQLPGPAWIGGLLQRLGRIPKRNCYLYGGAWMARPVHPPGLAESSYWGHSSNQQFYAMGPDTKLAPGDLVFLRPTQSEAVLQQFGPMPVYSGGRIVEEWAPLPTG